jgi:hypothetical protein
MGRSPVFIYCSGDRSSYIAIATDMVAESSAQDNPDRLYRDPRSAEVIPATVVIPIHVTPFMNSFEIHLHTPSTPLAAAIGPLSTEVAANTIMQKS